MTAGRDGRAAPRKHDTCLYVCVCVRMCERRQREMGDICKMETLACVRPVEPIKGRGGAPLPASPTFRTWYLHSPASVHIKRFLASHLERSGANALTIIQYTDRAHHRAPRRSPRRCNVYIYLFIYKYMAANKFEINRQCQAARDSRPAQQRGRPCVCVCSRSERISVRLTSPPPAPPPKLPLRVYSLPIMDRISHNVWDVLRILYAHVCV